MNIILMVIDTLRYDHIGANGNDWIKTPNMDRLAADSWVFDHCITGSYPTIPHRTDVITGRYGGPFHTWQPLPHRAVALPRLLARNGYCTQLLHDTPHLVNGGHNFDYPFHAWDFIRGAEVDRPSINNLDELPENWTWDPVFDFAEKEPFYKSNMVTYARANHRRCRPEDWNTAKLFLAANQWLQDNTGRDNFFLWLDCFDPHEPWDVPPDYLKMYDDTPGFDGRTDPRSFTARNSPDRTEAAFKRIKAGYSAKVSWVDHWLGTFLDTLEETGLADNTAVVFTADHGTNVGERGKFGKGYPVCEQEARVPLFVRTPDGGKGRSQVIVQPQDIFSTILALGETEAPAGTPGHNVMALTGHDAVGPRHVALAGRAASGWGNSDPDHMLFTVFDREWCLEYALRPEDCRLTALGSLEDVAAANPAEVERLRVMAMGEIRQRGADPKLISWLRAAGEERFPDDAIYFDGYPSPAGYVTYFGRLYNEWA